jgi:hypothetical protein
MVAALLISFASFAGAAELAVAVSSPAVASSTAAAVSVSTQASLAPQSFTVELTRSGYHDRVDILYKVPLSGDPLAWGPKLLSGLGRSLIHPLDTVRGTTFRIYGLRIVPKKLVVEDAPPPAGSRAALAQAEGKPESPETKRRKHLSLMPIWDDFQEDLRTNALMEGMDLAGMGGLDRQQKEAFLNDVVILNRQRDLPIFSMPLEGMSNAVEASSKTR